MTPPRGSAHTPQLQDEIKRLLGELILFNAYRETLSLEATMQEMNIDYPTAIGYEAEIDMLTHDLAPPLFTDTPPVSSNPSRNEPWT